MDELNRPGAIGGLSAGMVPGGPSRTMSPFESNLQGIVQHKEALYALIAELENKLQPILSPRLNGGNATKGQEKEEVQSAIVAFTKNHCQELQGMGVRIRGILERIEL